jgi:glycosyltransferase involved in cell wall biosynthesis
VLLDLHNIESEWHQRIAGDGNLLWRWGQERFAAFYRKQEVFYFQRFDTVLTTSKREASALSTPRSLVYRNAIPWAPVPNEAIFEPPSIAFSGNLEYAPNQQAIRWFARSVWPLLQRCHPTLEWRIIGKNPQAIRNQLDGLRNVVCTGPVADAIAVLAQSQIAIVPVLTGSGTRVKILEAWAARLPVVATTIGAEGLDAVPGLHFLLADSAAGFAASISQLLDAPDQRARIGIAGRRLYEENYTWDAAWNELSKVILPLDERLY